MVDNKASCVMVFQPNGKLVQRFGSRGNPSDPGKFAGPHFVAINSQDHIIVSDFHNHSIKVIYLIFIWALPENLLNLNLLSLLGLVILLKLQKISYAGQSSKPTNCRFSRDKIGKLGRRVI